MDRTITRELTAAFLALLIILLIFISGCSRENRFIGRGDRPGMSPEARQQMSEQMRQQSLDACSNKAESDACSIEMFEGRAMEGSCTLSNETLACINSTMMRPRGPENGA